MNLYGLSGCKVITKYLLVCCAIDLFHSLHFFLHWQHGVDPVDDGTTALHAAEPRHLALGKLVDGNLQLTHHLVVTEFSDDVLCDVFILQAIVGEVFGLDAAVKQTAHLLHHAMVETLMHGRDADADGR